MGYSQVMRDRIRIPSFSAATALLAAGFLTAGALPEAARASSLRDKVCAEPGSRTLRVSTRDIRIFTRKRNGETYGCHAARGRPYSLGELGTFTRFLRVAGPFVAHDSSFDSRDGTDSFVRVRNLRTGRLVRKAFKGSASGTDDYGTRVTDLEVRPTGSAAWIWDVSLPGFPFSRLAGDPPPQFEVRSASRSLPPTESILLDSGPDVDPRSLVLRGTTLSWTRAGVRRLAVLR